MSVRQGQRAWRGDLDACSNPAVTLEQRHTHTRRTANTSRQYDSLQQADQQLLRCAVPRCAVLYALR
jgi:HD superfamily phosphohydrolase YqeK